MPGRFRHEDVSSVPSGWKVRTVSHGGHRVRVAFPPGRRRTGSGRLVSILHPIGENPCELRSSNPAELVIMGANPPRHRTIPQILNECDKLRSALRHRMNPSSLKVGDKVSFHGHDGKDYDARITEIRKGIAVIRYAVPGHSDEATAYVPRKEWRHRFNPESGHSSPRRVFFDDSIQKYTAAKFLKKYGNLIASGHTKAEAIRNLKTAIQRAKTGSHNPNPRVEVVHGDNPPVEEIVERFSGTPAEWIEVYNEPHMKRGRYAQLGPLIALYIKPLGGGQVRRIGAPENRNIDWQTYWSGDPPVIVTDDSARKIYFVGRNQDITAGLEAFGPRDRGEGLLELGQCRRIDYEGRKEHVADPDEDQWKHDHGEENGVLPTVLFDTRAKRLLYEGGDYRIDGAWIRN